jgi:hypothetical protein
MHEEMKSRLISVNACYHSFQSLLYSCLPKKDEAMGEKRKLHSGELHNLYLSQNIIRQIKSRGMRWVGRMACMGEE